MLKLDSDKQLESFIVPYRIDDPKRFSLDDHDPADTDSLPKSFKSEAQTLLNQGIEWMAEQQAMLAAQDQWSLLVIFQARDAAGKDSTIRHVMTGLNPQGCHVTSFKHPHHEDLDHDYLWRYHRRVPSRGEIGIFNRSHYEEVLVVRVHEELLRLQRLPEEVITKRIWEQRFEDINSFERYLSRNGVQILKFFLNVSREEQKERFLSRLEHPEKHWKFSSSDIEERRFWNAYSEAFEDMVKSTSSECAPWYVVPADNKWFTRLVVASAMVAKLKSMSLTFPKVGKARLEEFASARKELEDD